MTDEATATQEAPENPESEPQGETPQTPDRLPDDHPVVKALNKANKEAEQARLRIKEFEDRDKSDQDRLAEKASELEGKLTTAEANAARFEIALEKGLTKNQAKRLVGSTRDELEADADELLADLGVTPDEAPAHRSKERLKPGATPDAEPTKSPEELADAVVKRQRGF